MFSDSSVKAHPGETVAAETAARGYRKPRDTSELPGFQSQLEGIPAPTTEQGTAGSDLLRPTGNLVGLACPLVSLPAS